MRIFGRKANQQSASPAAPNVPPELQPYYGRPSLGTRLRRIGLFVLPVVAALALVVALIAGGMWIKNRSDENKPKVATSQSTTQKPATNNEDSNKPQNGSNPNQSEESQPSSNSSNSPGSTNDSNSTNESTGQPSASSNTSSQSSPSNIPSTGPDSGMYLVALAMAIAGTALAYLRQLKTIRR